MPLNEEQKKELERRVKRSAAAQRIFDCPDGEIVLGEIRSFCYGESFIYDPKSPDIVSVSVRAGKHDVYHFIMNMLKGDVDKAREILNAGTEEGRKTE